MTAASITTDVVAGRPRIAVDHAGSGPLVVCLHGIGGNRSFWREQLVALAPQFHAAAWDARGYGESDDYDGPLVFSDFADDLTRVLDHFRAARAHVVGLSMGGIIAMDFYARHRDRVATLTICDSTPGLAHIPPDQLEEFIRSRKAPLLAGKEPRDIAPAVARALARKSAPEAVLQRLIDGMSVLHKESYLKAIDAVNRVSGFALEEILVPTHVLVGDEDELTPPDVSRRMASRIPGAKLTILREAGHISNIEQPDAFNDAMLPFLRAHRDDA